MLIIENEFTPLDRMSSDRCLHLLQELQNSKKNPWTRKENANDTLKRNRKVQIALPLKGQREFFGAKRRR